MPSSRDRRSVLMFAAVAVILAVTATKSGGDGWESNPPRTPQQRPANGFEDRGTSVCSCPLTFARVYWQPSELHKCPRAFPLICHLGCLLGCRRSFVGPLGHWARQRINCP